MHKTLYLIFALLCLTSCKRHNRSITGEWLLEDVTIKPSAHLTVNEKTTLQRDFESSKPGILSLSHFFFLADSSYSFDIAGNVSEGKYHFIHNGNTMIVDISNHPEYALQQDTFAINFRDSSHIDLSQDAPFGKLILYLKKI